FYCSCAPRALPSFPTRRSSDLWLRGVELSRFDVDLGRRSVALGALRLRGPEVWVRRTGSELTIPGLAAGPTAPSDEAAWTVTLRSEEHTSELQSLAYLVCRLLL